ncbi:hypothetical protein BYT27DRAFT_7187068 [Phlegmacium glaucopus]|nr:hypothetical protein BYT27DRAFT_7187068 [Phlegmacium glaucopus]
MALADKGWTEPKLYAKLLFSGGFKRYGSSFLFFAILLNILGGIISPLQSIFLTSRTIKIPTSPGTVARLTDILDLFNASFPQVDILPVLVRSALTYTSSTDVQSCLWTGSAIKCSNDTQSGPCALGGITLANMSLLPQPFLAQLPSGYNTGLVRQFLPRINSSATREMITEADFPKNCDTLPGSFYVNYANTYLDDFGGPLSLVLSYGWHLIACMPANQQDSPWKLVRTRQDFSEELYLNLSVMDMPLPVRDGATGLFKITVNTTVGFFELPNYMNGQLPGPLLDDDPSHYCDSDRDCIHQVDDLHPIGDYNLTSRSPLAGGARPPSRGPLLTTAIALFGGGSFIADRVTNPEIYINNITESVDINNVTESPYLECIDQAPLVGLLGDFLGQSDITTIAGNMLDPCVLRINANDGNSIQQTIVKFINTLYDDDYDGERIKNAFESAAFLANEALLKHGALFPTFAVSYDAGADTVVPAISRAGIILISLLLAVDLLSLVAMALYSAQTPCWTDQLDAFAMMRIGAAIAESIPFRVADTTDRIKVLDEIPGWVGDATEGKGKVGELGIGARVPLKGRRKYTCY